jgi:hypothetical protein
MPGDSGVTVVTTLVCFLSFCTRGCGRIERRHSLRPLYGGLRKFPANLGRNAPRERGVVSQRHCEEHLRRSNPFFHRAVKWIASLALAMTIVLVV